MRIALEIIFKQHFKTPMRALITSISLLLLTGCGQPSVKERAESGDANAEFELGCMLIEGRGVTKDTDMGIAWLKKAEKHGIASATIILREAQTSPSDKLLAVISDASLEVKRSTTNTILSGWCSGILRYKQAYGFYPGFGSASYPTSDKAYLLTRSTGAIFVKTLSGKEPDGTALTPGPAGDRAKYNRNSEAFVDFTPNDFQSLTQDNNSGTLITRNNKRVYLIVDYDNSGRISNISGVKLPSSLKSAATSEGYPARIIIFEEFSEGEEDSACIAAQ